MLKDADVREVNCKVLLAYRFKKLIAWAILSKEDSTFKFTKSDHFHSNDGWMFQVFVSPDYRRNGIGSEIFKKALGTVKQEVVHICPWNDTSYSFYKKFSHIKYKHL